MNTTSPAALYRQPRRLPFLPPGFPRVVRHPLRGLRSAALIAGLAAALRAEDAVPVYTLDDCLRIGLAQSAGSINARRDQQIAAALAKQAGSEALPQLSLNGRYNRLDELQRIEFQDMNFEIGSLNNYSSQAELSQLLYSGGRVRAALEAARLNRSYADWTLQEKELETARGIRLAFNNVLLAGAAVDVRRESVAQLEALLEQTRQKNRGGTASDFDVLSAQVRLENEKPQLLLARNERAVGMEWLRRLVTTGGTVFEIRGELQFCPVKADLDRLLSAGLERRPALKAMEKTVALKEQDVIAARARAWPELRASAAYSGSAPYGLGTSDNGWEWHWNAGLTASWDLWNGGLTAGIVEQKKLEWEKMRTELDDSRNAVRAEIRAAFLELQYAERSAEAVRDSIALAEKALGIARVRYDAGLTTRLEFTDASLALSTARLAWYRSLHAYEAAVTKLEYATGIKRSEF